ncbi:MAG: nitroreductase family protein [Bacteroidales bacterium]|nr:nitroreductase family protein [Bacteroidales bacterium]
MTMTLDEIITSRTSIRKYTSQVPSKDLLQQVAEAARQAPSAVNKQPWRVVIVTNSQKLAELRLAYNREWFSTAQAIIVVIGNHNQSWHRADGKDHCDIDIAIATEHMALKATDLGLSTCWVCNFDPELANRAMNISDGEEVCVFLPIGYADPETPVKPHQRKENKDIVSYIE